MQAFQSHTRPIYSTFVFLITFGPCFQILDQFLFYSVILPCFFTHSILRTFLCIALELSLPLSKPSFVILSELLADVLGAKEFSVTHRPVFESLFIESANPIPFGHGYSFLLSLVVAWHDKVY